jgi:CxxC motif-containing protein
MGCLLQVDVDGDVVEGNGCPRGRLYGLSEATEPVRVVTALAAVKGTDRPVSVKTDAPVPKALVAEVLCRIAEAEYEGPVAMGDVLISNVCSTSANVVATRDSR